MAVHNAFISSLYSAIEFVGSAAWPASPKSLKNEPGRLYCNSSSPLDRSLIVIAENLRSLELFQGWCSKLVTFLYSVGVPIGSR